MGEAMRQSGMVTLGDVLTKAMSREQLVVEKLRLQDSISSITQQLRNYEQRNGRKDPGWQHRVISAQSHIQQQLEYVNTLLAENLDARRLERQKSLEASFIKVASEKLDKVTFEALYNEAETLIKAGA